MVRLTVLGLWELPRAPSAVKRGKTISDRDIVVVDRIQSQMNCWMRDQQLSPTRHCKGTAHTSAGVCCRETRCMSCRRLQSTVDDTSTSSCCPLRLSQNLPESFQCVRAARTRRKYLSILKIGAQCCVPLCVFGMSSPAAHYSTNYHRIDVITLYSAWRFQTIPYTQRPHQ